MLKKKLVIAAVIMSALLPNIARSDDCAPIVKAADKALADQDRVIDLKTRTITSQDKIISAQDVRITELEKGTSLFKSPVFYILVGVVAGAFIVRR